LLKFFCKGFYLHHLNTNQTTLISGLPPLAGATGNGPTWAPDGTSFYYEGLESKSLRTNLL
jgi:hypothetical protein